MHSLTQRNAPEKIDNMLWQDFLKETKGRVDGRTTATATMLKKEVEEDGKDEGTVYI